LRNWLIDPLPVRADHQPETVVAFDREPEARGVIARAQNYKGLAEEQPKANNVVDEVVSVVDRAGLSKRVARMWLLGPARRERESRARRFPKGTSGTRDKGKTWDRPLFALYSLSAVIARQNGAAGISSLRPM
jgi:hypothetical protein